jgi:hypothetical protein
MKKWMMLLCFFVPFLSIAQITNKQASTFHYSAIVEVGVSEGAAVKPALNLQMTNGVRYSKWFAGAGFGLDYYAIKRSVPAFLSVRRSFAIGKKEIMLYADGGKNISWLRETDKKFGSTNNFKETNGWYYAVGASYVFKTGKNTAIVLSGGYSLKQHKESYNLIIWDPIPRPNNTPSNVYNYTYRRIQLKLGFRF